MPTLIRCVAALVLAALVTPAAAEARHHKRGPVEVQLIALNDFHGHIESTTPGRISPTLSTNFSSSSPPADAVLAGGAEYLATHVRAYERENPNTLVVSAGDLVGASPLLSAAFHDEPTIEAMNRIGLDLNAVGNHEFDEGAEELLRMQAGGCHPTDGCQDGDGFAGADFGLLAANVVRADSGAPILPPYAVRRFDGVKVGFIGMTLQGTPDIVSPAGIAGLRFLDEAETANRYARILHAQGVKAIVVLLHEGATVAAGGVNDCNGIGGAIPPIVEATTDKVDLFITGHTHQAYNCVIDGRPVTSASSNGRLVTDIDLEIHRRSRDIKSVSANNEIITQTVAKAPDLTALIQRYTTLVAPIRDAVIGRIAGDVVRTADASGESPLGNLIADAQLAASDDAGTGQAVAAFMNPGGVRTDLLFNQLSGGEQAGQVTYGESFNVQPFGNNVTTITLTGAQLYAVLEQQWCQPAQKILQPSSTVTYTYDKALATSRATCTDDRNPVTDLRIAGVPVALDQSYRVTVNSFLADGGDGFTVFRQGTNRLGGIVDTEALSSYLAPTLSGTPIAAPATDRIDLTTP